eukprot:2881340-Amphidinium_carterae.1
MGPKLFGTALTSVRREARVHERLHFCRRIIECVACTGFRNGLRSESRGIPEAAEDIVLLPLGRHELQPAAAETVAALELELASWLRVGETLKMMEYLALREVGWGEQLAARGNKELEHCCIAIER